jgi:PIN domain nuclease of toxin-antitoxin system
MRLLLDTHTLLWSAHDPRKLSADAAEAISDTANEVFVSAVSAMEIAAKHRSGKLEYDTSLATAFAKEVTGRGFATLAIDCAHATHAGNLPGENQDPWDRLLVAQAQLEGLTFVSKDAKLSTLGLKAFW